jgi:hypothetical protein
MSISPRHDANRVTQADAIAGPEPSGNHLAQPESMLSRMVSARRRAHRPSNKLILIGGTDQATSREHEEVWYQSRKFVCALLARSHLFRCLDRELNGQ